ncbi:hypothetical protein PGIGA_G00026740 [Pangasianodon gigas]|uniref:Uncharacterized protein n=1 Tax=Pangasianodon gigas TaxID=30993 RepID=A0ACC5WX54_PANGG|nr:hypothetical protein [Pangasianodon gigas]
MSMEDPFFVVKGEVQKAVNTAQGLYQRWTELLQDPGSATKEEIDWTTNELRNSLSTRQTVKEMKDQMASPMAMSLSEKKSRQTLMGDGGSRGPIWQPGGDKYTRLDRELQSANSQFIEEQQTQQQLIAEQQDEQLELVSGTIGVLKNMSERIGQELDEQAVMLDDFGHEMDNTQSRLDNVMKKLAKVSHMTSDRRQWCAIGILLAILFVVIILLIVL